MTTDRQVRVRLLVLLVVSILSVAITGIYYARIPQDAGIGRYPVIVQLEAGAGLYGGANVTYRGTQVGKVTELRAVPAGAEAIVSLQSGVPIPADTRAEVHSMSAVGEQYIDLVPDSADGPFLERDSVIPRDRTTIPQPVAPTLDRLNAALASIDPDTLTRVLDESSTALGGNGDVGRILDSLGTLATSAAENAEGTASLIEDLEPVLDATSASSDAIRAWAGSLSGVTGRLAASDADLRGLIDRGTPMATQVTGLFQDLRPTLPLLLANLTTVGQVAAVYNPALEQILVLYPPLIAATQGTGLVNADDPGQNTFFAAQLNDPPPCTTGFLPAAERRSPVETDTIPTPTDLYCKVDPADPSAIRGARNLPCIENPGRRAATVQLCRAGTTGYYDPASGSYIGPDGQRYVDASLTQNATPTTLPEMLIPGSDPAPR